MDIKTLEYKNINEVLHVYEHSSGLRVFIIPKKGYSKKYATFSTHYGSINNEFIVPGENEITRVPDGIAHFLEHKLFDQEYGNAMDKFSEYGSWPNAYTAFNQTTYLFSCTDNFADNFKILLEFVQNPYFTDESIEREKGIITQEIEMYRDNANWKAFFNLLDAFYKGHPVKLDIAGTVQSISEIDKDILYKCYNTFYHPSNMVVLVVGDVDSNEVCTLVNESMKTSAGQVEIKRIFKDEQYSVNKCYAEESLHVSKPFFQMGFKDCVTGNGGILSLKREVIINILLGMMVGKSSKIYEKLYNEGLIDNNFSFEYTIEENYAFSIFGGESKDPLKVRDIILDEIWSLHKTGLDERVYNRIKKADKGKFIRRFNSVEKISQAFTGVHFRGASLFDYLEVYNDIAFKECEQVFRQHFVPECFAISIINPVKEEAV